MLESLFKNNLAEMVDHQIHPDVVFQVGDSGGVGFTAHRFMLRASSPLLLRILTECTCASASESGGGGTRTIKAGCCVAHLDCDAEHTDMSSICTRGFSDWMPRRSDRCRQRRAESRNTAEIPAIEEL